MEAWPDGEGATRRLQESRPSRVRWPEAVVLEEGCPASSLGQVSDPSPAPWIQKLQSRAQVSGLTKASGDPLMLPHT